MKVEIFNRPDYRPRVLIAPLDWGLGHATRCIPVVLALINHHCDVIIAAEGAVKELLQKEFPGLVIIPLKGYRMVYSHKKFWLPAKLLLQLPKLFTTVKAENRWLKKAVERYDIDAVISDNRLGMYHSRIPSVYITHQLLIKTGNSFTQRVAQKIHYHFINKYASVWVPDWPGTINLAGELSHPLLLPKASVKYLSPLSRFIKLPEQVVYDLCVVISGPEPQRTIFENIIFKELENFSGRVVLIRGIPEEKAVPKIKNQLVEIKNHLSAAALNRIMQQSKFVISRSGYSTIMDLVKIQQKAILVPTPGQTEQEYLAVYLQQQELFYAVQQKEFSLAEAIKTAESFPFKQISGSGDKLDNVVKQLVDGLHKISSAGT